MKSGLLNIFLKYSERQARMTLCPLTSCGVSVPICMRAKHFEWLPDDNDASMINCNNTLRPLLEVVAGLILELDLTVLCMHAQSSLASATMQHTCAASCSALRSMQTLTTLIASAIFDTAAMCVLHDVSSSFTKTSACLHHTA